MELFKESTGWSIYEGKWVESKVTLKCVEIPAERRIETTPVQE